MIGPYTVTQGPRVAPLSPETLLGAHQSRGSERSASARSECQRRSVGLPREASSQRAKPAPLSLLETSTTMNILHPPGPPCYTDSVEEHRYRSRVADKLEAMGWLTRANALRMCGRAAIQVDCGACAAPHLVPFRCGARVCPTCARNAASALVDRISAKAQLHDAMMETITWDGAEKWDNLTYYTRAGSDRAPKGWKVRTWRVLTLTRRTHNVEDPFQVDGLRAQVRESRRLFGAWWRATPWGRQRRDAETKRKRSRRDTSYILGLEIAPGGMVHFHVAIYGEYVQQRVLLAWWRATLQKAGAATSERDGGVRVEKVRTRAGVTDALREVLKYATKGQTRAGVEQMPTATHAAVVECAFRNVRRSDVGGAMRAITSASICDVLPDDLHNNAVAACQACGTVGDWLWRGVRSRDLVTANGGFGLEHIYGDDDPARYRGPPDRGYC